jgi:CheY-like chemotaxis protein
MSGACQTPSSGAAGPVILCVDDEVTPLTIRKFVLQKAGYSVLTASSGAAALEILQNTNVDLVLSDHLMPEMTGTELVSQVRCTHPTLPFIILSGLNDIPVGAELADEFLSKLEGPEAMIDRVRALISRKIA